MRLVLAAAALLAIGAADAPSSEKRCGWIQNPTPANWWLVDRDGEWTLSVQGGYQAEGMDLIPDLTVREWKRTNGSYGYGCGCVTGRFDAAEQRVIELTGFRQQPIAACRRDKALPKP